MKKYYFITYGTEAFNTSKKHIINLAKKFDIFENYYALGPKDLGSDFKKNFSEILKLKRGAGYWIWKHHIIYNLLNEINTDDVIVYCDSGSSLNYFAKKRLFDYFELLNDSEYGSLMFECEKQYIEKHWTTKQLLEYFDSNNDQEILNSTQLEATQMIFKKNKNSDTFFKEYRKLLNHDTQLITDKYNKINQEKYFIDNRHDQSIFSILSKKLGSEVLSNESHHENNIKNQYQFPFLAVRTYGHGKKDKIKFALNYKDYRNTPVYFKEKEN
tara:strand:+ start:38193 stop:39005 length:813 start_codon:yes stop_codon:yes gene_type:complete